MRSALSVRTFLNGVAQDRWSAAETAVDGLSRERMVFGHLNVRGSKVPFDEPAEDWEGTETASHSSQDNVDMNDVVHLASVVSPRHDQSPRKKSAPVETKAIEKPKGECPETWTQELRDGFSFLPLGDDIPSASQMDCLGFSQFLSCTPTHHTVSRGTFINGGCNIVSLLDAAAVSETNPEEDNEHETDEGQTSAEAPAWEGLKIWDLESRSQVPPSKTRQGTHWKYKFMDPGSPIPNTLEPPRDYKTELVSEGVSLDWKTVHGYLNIPFHVGCLK